MPTSIPTYLDLAASIDPDVVRDVFFDDDDFLNFGKLNLQLNQEYGRIGFDSASTEFRIEAAKDGAGTFRDIVFRTSGAESARIDAARRLSSGAFRIENANLGTAIYFESTDGQTAAVSAANEGRQRYNAATQQWEWSQNTGAYFTFATGGTAFVQNGNSFGGLATLGTNDAFALAFETNGIPRMNVGAAGGVSVVSGTFRVTDGTAAIGAAISVEALSATAFAPGVFVVSSSLALYNASTSSGTFESIWFFNSSFATSGFQLAGLRRGPADGTARTDLVGSAILPGIGVPFRVFTFHGDAGALIIGSATGPFVAELLRVQGDARIEGKLTVTGVIDPTALILSTGTDLYIESNDGSTAAVSGAATGRQRYNDASGMWESSTKASVYGTLSKAPLGFGALAGAAEGSLVRWGDGTSGSLIVDSVSARIQLTQPGTLNGLYVRVAAAFGVATGVTYTVRVNGADTAITCTISGAAAISANDTTHFVVVGAGDNVEIHVTVASGVPINAITAAELGIS